MLFAAGDATAVGACAEADDALLELAELAELEDLLSPPPQAISAAPARPLLPITSALRRENAFEVRAFAQ